MKTSLRLLTSHGIEVVISKGRLLANDAYTLNRELYDNWVDVTDYSVYQIKLFLGY